MGLRVDEYQLTKSIELDECFFETVNKDLPKDAINKRGRGSQKPTTVLVMIQSKENKENKNKIRLRSALSAFYSSVLK